MAWPAGGVLGYLAAWNFGRKRGLDPVREMVPLALLTTGSAVLYAFRHALRPTGGLYAVEAAGGFLFGYAVTLLLGVRELTDGEDLTRRRFLGVYYRTWLPAFLAVLLGAIPGVLAGAILALRLWIPPEVDVLGWLWVGSGMAAGGVAGWRLVWCLLYPFFARKAGGQGGPVEAPGQA
ncbi:MAG: hypothetical protein AB1816_03030, partial [Bacillota bacterium]